MPTLRDRFAAARAGWNSGRSTRVPAVAPQWSPAGLRPRRARAVTGTRNAAQQSIAQPQSRAQTAFQAVTALTAVAALLFTARSLDYTADVTRATRDQIDLAAQGQVAERFSQAIDQLGQTGPDKLSIRLGGIYSLERLMRDSPADEPTVIEVLCAFVRTNAPEPVAPSAAPYLPPEAAQAPEDIRAAVAVLGRRPNPEHSQNRRLDFGDVELSMPEISLAGANLAGANLHFADLRFADLAGANLRDADLAEADLTGVNLRDADLTGAQLYETDLSKADLRGANLTGSHLLNGVLAHADLAGAALTGADLRAAHLGEARNLTSVMLRCSQTDDRTELPPGVARSSDVPPSRPISC